MWPENISFYVHIPFCPQICHFCGCNTSLFRDEKEVEHYINALLSEIETISEKIDKRRVVTQIHWGGGTPNSISFKWIKKVMDYFYKHFTIDPEAEVAMECNPAYMELTDLIELSKMGFNRLSIGVQDFDKGLLKKLNRIPSKYPLKDLFRTARKAGIESMNLDLMYGLPDQTLDQHIDSVQKAIDLEADRIVTFSYAHVPWFKSNQKKLEEYTLPDAEEKLTMLESSYDLLVKNDYVPIGMDHYVKPEDELHKALKNKNLHRNFQGYASRAHTGQVYAFGATAISQLQNAYSQNIRSVKKYIEHLNNGHLPVFRGYELTKDEIIIRKVISEIMCNHYINWDQIAGEMNISPVKIREIVNYDPENLQSFINDEMISVTENEIEVTSKGFFLIRNIAMAFDPQLNQENQKYSRTI
jgi:oxygen-independent coproporphyrinogen-3 oxidase